MNWQELKQYRKQLNFAGKRLGFRRVLVRKGNKVETQLKLTKLPSKVSKYIAGSEYNNYFNKIDVYPTIPNLF